MERGKLMKPWPNFMKESTQQRRKRRNKEREDPIPSQKSKTQSGSWRGHRDKSCSKALTNCKDLINCRKHIKKREHRIKTNRVSKPPPITRSISKRERDGKSKPRRALTCNYQNPHPSQEAYQKEKGMERVKA